MHPEIRVLTPQEMKDRIEAPESPRLIPAALKDTPTERSKEMNSHRKYPIDTTDMVFVIESIDMWAKLHAHEDVRYYHFEVVSFGLEGSVKPQRIVFDFQLPHDRDVLPNPGESAVVRFQGLAVEVNGPGKITGVYYYTFDSITVVAPNNSAKKEAKKCSHCHS
jgi:hypothetical protein